MLKHFLLGRCSSQHYDRSQQTRQHSCPNPKVLATTPPRVTCVLPQRRARMRPTPMQPVHRNTPPPPQSTQRQLGVGGRGATPGSAMSSVFASPGSPGSTGSPGGHKYGTVAQRLTYPAADELSLEPYDGTEQDEAEAGEEAAADAAEAAKNAEHAGKALQEEQRAASDAALDVAERAEAKVAELRELLVHSNRQLDELRTALARKERASADSAELRKMVAQLAEATLVSPAPAPASAPTTTIPQARASSPSPPLDAGASVQLGRSPAPDGSHGRTIARSPARSAKKTPERSPGLQPSVNRSEHRGVKGSFKAQAKSALQHERAIDAAFSAGASPQQVAAMEAASTAVERVRTLKEKPKAECCPYCGIPTLAGGFAQHVTACGHKDAAQRLHRFKFDVRPHLHMLNPAHVWKRAIELHFMLKYWDKMHSNIIDEACPGGKERIAADKDFVIFSPSDLRNNNDSTKSITEIKVLTCPRDDEQGFGISASYRSGCSPNSSSGQAPEPWSAHRGTPVCEVTKDPPSDSPGATATDLLGNPSPVTGDPISGTKILKVERTLVAGNLVSLLEDHAEQDDTIRLTCVPTPTKEDVVAAHPRTLAALKPPLTSRSASEQKALLADVICTVADPGSDYSFNPDARAPCPTCCCTSEFGQRVELYSFTQLVNHCFRDHWHKGDPNDRRNLDPRRALPAQSPPKTTVLTVQPTAAADTTEAIDPGNGATGVKHLAQAEADFAEELTSLQLEMGEQDPVAEMPKDDNDANNPWARPQQSPSYVHTAIRPDWKNGAALNGLEMKRKPRLARRMEATLFGTIQQGAAGASAADIFVCAVNISSDGKHWSHDNIELFGSGPDDVGSDAALTTYTDNEQQTLGEVMCTSSTVGWSRAHPGRYRIWASSRGDQNAISSVSAGFKVMLRCGDDHPVVYDGSWMKGRIVDDLLCFDFTADAAPQLETGRYDQVAFPHKKLLVGDLWSLGRCAPAQMDLLMLQLDCRGDYIASSALDAKNTRTEWRRPARAGKRVDNAPWMQSGETVSTHSYWRDEDDRNHRLEVNLDYIAPDVDSLVFIAKARPQLDGSEHTHCASIQTPQIVLMAPASENAKAQTSAASDSEPLLGTYACPNLSSFSGGDAVVMCRLFRKRPNGPAPDAEWDSFENPFGSQPHVGPVTPTRRSSSGLPAGYMGGNEIGELNPDTVECVLARSRSPMTSPEQLAGTGNQEIVGQQSSGGTLMGVRTLMETAIEPATPWRREREPTHLSVRVGGGWAPVPRSPRPGAAARSPSPSRSRGRHGSPTKRQLSGQQLSPRVQSPPTGTARQTAVRVDTQWYLETVGRPLELHASVPTKMNKRHFTEICEEMKGWGWA